MTGSLENYTLTGEQYHHVTSEGDPVGYKLRGEKKYVCGHCAPSQDIEYVRAFIKRCLELVECDNCGKVIS